MLREALPDIARGYPNNCVRTSVVARRPPEDLDADRLFLQRLKIRSQGPMNDETQKFSTPVAAFKGVSLQHSLQMLFDRGKVPRSSVRSRDLSSVRVSSSALHMAYERSILAPGLELQYGLRA
jgi:hypothetical protein